MNDKDQPMKALDDELEPRLESAVWAVLSEPICSEAIERVKARAAGLDNQPRGLARLPARAERHRGRWYQLAALAAGILVVIGATIMMPTTPTAFAQVIERLKSAGAFRYKELVYTTTQAAPIEVEVMVAENGRERRELLGTVSIHDTAGRLRLSLIEASKTAIVHEPSRNAYQVAQRQLKWLEQLKAHGDKPDKDLGLKSLDGRNCRGFEVKLAHAVYTIWVDDKANELVQIEFAGMPEGSPVIKSVMKDFRFDQTFDESLFKFEVPSGYRATESTPTPELLPAEESLVEALRGYTELSKGKFPKSIADWGEWAVLFSEQGQSPTQTSRLMARIGSVLPFLTAMSPDDYEYLGAGRTVNDERTIVFWYRNADRKLRAIYSDLSVGEIREKELPSP